VGAGGAGTPVAGVVGEVHATQPLAAAPPACWPANLAGQRLAPNTAPMAACTPRLPTHLRWRARGPTAAVASPVLPLGDPLCTEAAGTEGQATNMNCKLCRRSQLHDVQALRCCRHLPASLRLWVSARGASSGGAAGATTAGEALHRVAASRGLLLNYAGADRICLCSWKWASASLLAHATLAGRQLRCWPCLRIRAASTHPARLQGLGLWSSTTAAWQSSRGPNSRHTGHAGSTTQEAFASGEDEGPGVQQGAMWQLWKAQRAASTAGRQRSGRRFCWQQKETLLPMQHRITSPGHSSDAHTRGWSRTENGGALSLQPTMQCLRQKTGLG
jgi:hypothetical protein